MNTIAIIGPGAMGTLFAAYLKKAGMDVTLIDHKHERAARLEASGISVKGIRGDLSIKVPVRADSSDLYPVDLVMVCVKAYNTSEALRRHRRLVGPDTAVLSVQNGLGNIEAMAELVSEKNIIAGTTTVGANQLSPGMVHHAGDGDTVIGTLTGEKDDRLASIARVMKSAGFNVLLSDKIMESIWTKLIINVGINALTSIINIRNGVLADHAPTRTLMRAAVEEAIDIASDRGLSFDPGTMYEKVLQVAKQTAQNRSSMLVDIQMGRKTEVDFINGAISKLGDAPVNLTLTNLVHALEATFNQGRRQD